MVGMSTMVPWLETTFMDERYFLGWKGNHWSMVGSSFSWLKTTFMDGGGWFGINVPWLETTFMDGGGWFTKPVNLFLHFACKGYLGDRPPRPPGKGESIR